MASNRLVRALGALLLAAVALAAASCGGSGKSDGNKLDVALQDDAVFLKRDYYNRGTALKQAQDLGVTRLRVLLIWSRVIGADANLKQRPSTIHYDWSAYDSLIDDAARHGIRLQLNLTAPAPAWAAGDHKVGVVRPDAQEFGQFAAAAARHFKGRVDMYSIWNEPNYVGWLAPLRAEPELYRALYTAAYNGIKTADPAAKVLIGETAPYSEGHRALAPLAFLRDVLCRNQIYAPVKQCPPLHADGYAHHPYEFANPPAAPYPGADNVTMGTLGRLTAALDRLASAKALTTPDGKSLDVYLTEFGYFASGPVAPPPAQRASYLKQAFDIAQRNSRVKEMLQYILVSPPPGTRFDTSLIAQDGKPSLPFTALSAWARDNVKDGRVREVPAPLHLPPAP
jgi:hypothetical protein